ncbi:primase-like DNA-binding domain-containing protein [Natronorubrum sulfidifaciens]|uniref:Conjugation protein n=1 Tax=Natronorubrum sulfidifaciens JCM 14089 TaxID=1230460 RepID=L9VZY0_9EURY|nr:primase-like DNA-binding domain-containing protein [Natronorubrum sulfidifaciens]ELY41613.1 conjugation protein [Natronorubrum sulfidifaciens JCM 14089]
MSNTEYLKITPSSEPIHRTDVPATLESLHKLSNPASTSFWNRADPRVDTAPPTFEFLVVSTGPDEPVEFYYGVDQEAHVKTLEKRLTSIFPHSFTITKTELDLEEALVPERDISQEGHSDLELDEQQPSSEDEPIDDSKGDHEYVEPSPLGVEWMGKTGRKEDWMTTITPFVIDEPDEEYDAERPPLSAIVDALHEMTVPTAYQVVWQRKPDWRDDAEIRKSNLRNGRDTWSEELIGSWIEPVDADPKERELSQETQNRIRRIESKHPRRTFTVNVRAVAMGDPDDTDLHTELEQLKSSLDPLEGPFYELVGRRIREKGILSRRKAKRAQRHLERVLDAEIVTGGRKTKPDFVFNADELANLIVVPGGEDLTVEGSRGARSEQRSRNPLPRPHPDLMEEFREGMAIGYALDENGGVEDEPVRIPPSLLPTHYVRAATTGGGKSKSLTNDKLSLYEDTDGPIVLIDAKGDGLCPDYMRAHAHRFGMDDLEENVIHFPIPDVLPGFAFFNLESTLENGVNRVDAVQRKADHYEEILKMVMGEERYERAVVAPNLIKYLIKTLYDAEYGRENGRYRESENYFAHDQLEHVVDQLWQAGPPDPEGSAPRSSNAQVRSRIERQLQLDQNSFSTVMGGVSNRLDYISQDEHLRRLFNNTDPQFDFREILDERKVILFDLSGLRDDSAKAMTGVILTQLYDALKERGDELQEKPDDYVVNLIIDEASSLAISDVMSTLLEKGRGFRLSVGLSLQFPEQLDVKGGREVYLNVLNDVGSPIIGKIAVDKEIARVMAHEEMDPIEFANRIRSLPRGEWIVRLPSPTFGKTGPEPFSLTPLPIPAGHSESDDPLTVLEEQEFQRTLDRIHERANAEYGTVTDAPPSSQTPETVRSEFELPTDELDVALSRAVRTVQLRHGVQDENGWVPVQSVDKTVRTQYEAATESPPSIAELSDIRERSRLLQVTLHEETSEVVVRLTDDGKAVTEPDTGDVRSAGGETHDALLFAVEDLFSQQGFDVTIFTQDGSEKPDGRAIHPDCEDVFDIEVESATVEKPVKILRNFQRARNAGNIPIFVVANSVDSSDDGTQTAARIESILSSPVNKLDSGERRLYTTDLHITFEGGANAREGVTAVRPTVSDSRRSVWTETDRGYVLSDAQGTEFVAVSSFESLSRSDVPGVYSYDRAAGEYVVYEHNKRHVYNSKSDFEQDWVQIRRPFIPESAFTDVAASKTYEIVVIDANRNSARRYRDGESLPLETLVNRADLTDSATDLPVSVDSSPAVRDCDDNDVTADDSRSSETTCENESSSDTTETDFSSFVAECIIEHEGADIPKDELYEAYQVWAATYKQKEYSKSWFSRKLSEHVTYGESRPTRDGQRVNCYTGITLSSQGREFAD